jgi:hypothetical protein
MRIELNSSNRNEWPLGTGRSPMHGASLTDGWRRSTHGPRGTAQGNRGSASHQGGVRRLDGFLPFLNSVSVVQRSAHAKAVTATVAVPFLVPALFREQLMSITHFLLGCAVVAAAFVAHACISCIASALLWCQPSTH